MARDDVRELVEEVLGGRDEGVNRFGYSLGGDQAFVEFGM